MIEDRSFNESMNMGFANSTNTLTAAIPTVPTGMPNPAFPAPPGTLHSNDQFKNRRNSNPASDDDKKQHRFMTGLAVGGTVLAGLVILLMTKGKSKAALEHAGHTQPKKASYWRDDFASDLADFFIIDAGTFAVESLLEGLLGAIF